MNICGFAGYSGVGKTTLVEGMVTELRMRGLSVSVIKHAHESFDVDKPGKDSHRHREAGAYEVLLVSKQRMALLREWQLDDEPRVQDLVPELSEVDWLLVEGFKWASIPKLEVWRAANGKPVIYPEDPFVMAIATDSADLLPVPTQMTVLDINAPLQVVDFLLANQSRFEFFP
jgi:molybdopterin-guanine dinucleotide biosynthesis adapter protein